MKVNIATAQYPITEHDSFAAWASHVEKWVSEAVIQGAQLLVFPEYGSMELVSIFSQEIRQDIRRQLKELDSLKNDFCHVFADLSKKYGTIIVAPSIPVVAANWPVNRAYVFSKAGLVGYQDKLFMTRFEREEWGIESGAKVLTLFEADWGSFGIQICYDVEFGIGTHLLSTAGASLILAPSCTESIRGATRVHIGARARALEHQLYTVVSQTVGDAAWSPAVDINYGYSAIYSTPDSNFPEEGIVSAMTPQQQGWLTTELDFSKIQYVRDNGQVFNFRDQQRIATDLVSEKITVIRKRI